MLTASESTIDPQRLFPVTAGLIAHHLLQGMFVRIEPHGDGDSEDDILWLRHTPEDPNCEGEYLAVSQDAHSVSADHDSANRFGGYPTHWSYTGPAQGLAEAVAKRFRRV